MFGAEHRLQKYPKTSKNKIYKIQIIQALKKKKQTSSIKKKIIYLQNKSKKFQNNDKIGCSFILYELQLAYAS